MYGLVAELADTSIVLLTYVFVNTRDSDAQAERNNFYLNVDGFVKLWRTLIECSWNCFFGSDRLEMRRIRV